MSIPACVYFQSYFNFILQPTCIISLYLYSYFNNLKVSKINYSGSPKNLNWEIKGRNYPLLPTPTVF